MKVVCVVDSISELTNKIDTLKSRFGNNILYVVKNNLLTIFKTYGYQANAVYCKNLPRTIHSLLLPGIADDVIMYYTSLPLTNSLLNNFIKKIGDKKQIVNVMPKYNIFEKMCNNAYNIYVSALFKGRDSMATPKLQFLPCEFVVELLSTHFANKLFELDDEFVKTIEIEDKELNKTIKTKTKFNKFQLLPIIAALLITLVFVITLAFVKVNYIIALIFIFLYVLDILLAIIQQCKIYFDQRFMK